MHARHDSPLAGRFLQPDPSAAEANLYGYAGNSPVTQADPTGRLFWFVVGGRWRRRLAPRGRQGAQDPYLFSAVRRLANTGCSAGSGTIAHDRAAPQDEPGWLELPA